MDRFPRFVIGFIIAIVIFIAFVNFAHIPVESYAPPPTLYKFCTAKAEGTVTKLDEKTLVDHILEGQDTWYYVEYTFKATPVTVTTDAKTAKGGKGKSPAVETEDQAAGPAKTYNGMVRVDGQVYNQVKPGLSVSIAYDPAAPQVNGVPGTMGQWSTTTGYLNPYLWWYIGIIALTFLAQEIIRVATRTNDLR